MTVPNTPRPRRSTAAKSRIRRSSSLIGESFRAGRSFDIDNTATAAVRRRALKQFSTRLQG
ncbi:hypothetical protein GCU67_13870 [Modestobacter muralis]|uniref:Uncharacterized protein n=1 Tax=Modestobacter muralis TaxID=1608614 RepID=A0A6P0H8L8_9ACTN|nr:hypothetical protein [Modestobacter muralis]NEK95243.1 hypothetical protein [Modestobacter muralis]NEN52131.1 hypothetical protein [Modestobacter muralis]